MCTNILSKIPYILSHTVYYMIIIYYEKCARSNNCEHLSLNILKMNARAIPPIWAHCATASPPRLVVAYTFLLDGVTLP